MEGTREGGGPKTLSARWQAACVGCMIVIDFILFKKHKLIFRKVCKLIQKQRLV